jgi:hypothetical protein
MHTVIALIVLAGPVLAGEVWYRFDTDPVHVAPGTAEDNQDWYGEPDWALHVETSDGRHAAFPAEEQRACYYCTTEGVQARAQILELDPGGCVQIVTVTVALPLESGPHELSFPDGSRARVAVERFEPEGMSGTDATPAGASPVQLGQPAGGRVWFAGGDRTDHWVLEVTGEPVEVRGYLLHEPETVEVSWLDPDGTPVGEPTTLAPGAHILRVRAPVPAGEDPGERRYQVLLLPTADPGAAAARLTQALLELAAAGERPTRLALQLAPELQHDTVPPVILEALDRPEPRVRAFAAFLAGELAPEQARPRLQQLADSPDEPAEVRSAARSALEKKGSGPN